MICSTGIPNQACCSDPAANVTPHCTASTDADTTNARAAERIAPPGPPIRASGSARTHIAPTTQDGTKKRNCHCLSERIPWGGIEYTNVRNDPRKTAIAHKMPIAAFTSPFATTPCTVFIFTLLDPMIPLTFSAHLHLLRDPNKCVRIERYRPLIHVDSGVNGEQKERSDGMHVQRNRQEVLF
jgi:hypothetical protein